MVGFLRMSIPPWIEEIKTSRRQGSAPDLIDHIVYRAIEVICMDDRPSRGREHINAQLTFIHPDSLLGTPARFEWHIDELAQFAMGQLQAFVECARGKKSGEGKGIGGCRHLLTQWLPFVRASAR